MIRRVTGRQLVGIVIRHKRGDSIELSASQIFHVEQTLITTYAMDTYLCGAAFLELKEDFPTHVKILPNSIKILKAKELSKKLERELRFARDQQTEDCIWKLWQSKR